MSTKNSAQMYGSPFPTSYLIQNFIVDSLTNNLITYMVVIIIHQREGPFFSSITFIYISPKRARIQWHGTTKKDR